MVKPRWLLLGVSVICLLVLLPASALSQGPEVTAGCGTPQIDGQMPPGEWDNATPVTMFPAAIDKAPGPAGCPVMGESCAAQNGGEASGTLLLMNDEDYLYVGVMMDFEPSANAAVRTSGMVLDPNDWHSYGHLVFTDEGDAGDSQWEAAGCDPLPKEGQFFHRICSHHPIGPEFKAWSQAGPCCNDWFPAEGIDSAGGPGGTLVTLIREWRIDLTDSQLDKVAAPGCFRFGAALDGYGTEADNDGLYGRGAVEWPEGLWPPGWPDEEWRWPESFGTLCLNPCGVGFVPEPGSILLLGSGLAGLAGYATLRVRSLRAG